MALPVEVMDSGSVLYRPLSMSKNLDAWMNVVGSAFLSAYYNNYENHKFIEFIDITTSITKN